MFGWLSLALILIEAFKDALTHCHKVQRYERLLRANRATFNITMKSNSAAPPQMFAALPSNQPSKLICSTMVRRYKYPLGFLVSPKPAFLFELFLALMTTRKKISLLGRNQISHFEQKSPQNESKAWTWSYKNIFSVDLHYAGILVLWLAENGHITFISHKNAQNSASR